MESSFLSLYFQPYLIPPWCDTISFLSPTPQLEHARLTQTELMRESFRHNQEMNELLQKQEELQERLLEESRAREQLALELHRAEGEFISLTFKCFGLNVCLYLLSAVCSLIALYECSLFHYGLLMMMMCVCISEWLQKTESIRHWSENTYVHVSGGGVVSQEGSAVRKGE